MKRGDMMLVADHSLHYPRVAPESPGSFFDGTEIDEMLTLRVLTMTDDGRHGRRR
jgi:hydrogenase maturation protease